MPWNRYGRADADKQMRSNRCGRTDALKHMRTNRYGRACGRTDADKQIQSSMRTNRCGRTVYRYALEDVNDRDHSVAHSIMVLSRTSLWFAKEEQCQLGTQVDGGFRRAPTRLLNAHRKAGDVPSNGHHQSPCGHSMSLREESDLASPSVKGPSESRTRPHPHQKGDNITAQPAFAEMFDPLGRSLATSAPRTSRRWIDRFIPSSGTALLGGH
jgi:hypothetical protein